MDAYVGHIIQAVVTLGGVGVLMGRFYGAVIARFVKLETKLDEYDRGKSDRDALRRAEAADIARTYCRTDCPRAVRGGTDPHLHAYTGPIAPDGA